MTQLSSLLRLKGHTPSVGLKTKIPLKTSRFLIGSSWHWLESKKVKIGYVDQDQLLF